MRLRQSSAWFLITALHTIIGLGGVPDDIQTGGEWLKAMDARMDHDWVRILVWAISVAVFTDAQRLPCLLQRFAGWVCARPAPPDPPRKRRRIDLLLDTPQWGHALVARR